MLSLIPALILAVLHGPAAFHSDAKFGWNAERFQTEEGASAANRNGGISAENSPVLAESPTAVDPFFWNDGNFLAVFSQLLSLIDAQSADNPPAIVLHSRMNRAESIGSRPQNEPPEHPTDRSDLIRDGPLA